MEKKIKDIIASILAVIIVVFVSAVCLMWLWNAIIIDLFAAPSIGYWQAMGICFISQILFRMWTVPNDSNK